MTSKQRDSTQASESPARQSRLDQSQTEKSSSSGWKRRRFLSVAGGVAVAGLLAGCTNGSNRNTGGDDGSDGESVAGWLAETDNYGGSVTDITGKTSVTVEVGAEGNNGANAFAPAAIEISLGTTVTWEWVNGYHNVVAKNGQFESGEPEQNATFEHTFETTGTVLYYCQPHKSLGMKGSVIVAGSDRAERSSASSRAKPGDTTSAGNTSTQSEAQ